MNFENIQKLMEKGIKGSGEKQLAIFMKNKTNSHYFREAANPSVK